MYFGDGRGCFQRSRPQTSSEEEAFAIFLSKNRSFASFMILYHWCLSVSLRVRRKVCLASEQSLVHQLSRRFSCTMSECFSKALAIETHMKVVREGSVVDK